MTLDSNPTAQPLYFNCKMCGECCSSWNIPIEAGKAKKLLEKPWVQTRLQETNRQLTPITEDTYRIPLTDENVCVFLAEDRRCMVESQEGLALKPHECQRFPFATVSLPDGTTWHETSAACKSISEKLLLAFQPIQPKPSQPEIDSAPPWEAVTQPLTPEEDDYSLSASLEPVAHFPQRIPVSGLREMSQAQYQNYQAGLRAIFTNPEWDPQTALRQANELLKQVSRHSQKRPIQPTFKHDVSIIGCFPGLLVKLLTIGFLRKPYRTMSWVNLILGQTYPDPRIFGLPVELAQIRHIPWNPTFNLRLNAFLYNLLQRKRMVALGSSLSAHFAMAGVACLLVQWYARALAWMQESREISEQDVSGAIRLVERYYTGHQPRFLEFFASRWRGEGIYWLLFGL